MRVGDLVEAYEWLRDHTPHDARVMAWWDYGYQINGIANRTTAWSKWPSWSRHHGRARLHLKA